MVLILMIMIILWSNSWYGVFFQSRYRVSYCQNTVPLITSRMMHVAVILVFSQSRYRVLFRSCWCLTGRQLLPIHVTNGFHQLGRFLDYLKMDIQWRSQVTNDIINQDHMLLLGSSQTISGFLYVYCTHKRTLHARHDITLHHFVLFYPTLHDLSLHHILRKNNALH